MAKKLEKQNEGPDSNANAEKEIKLDAAQIERARGLSHDPNFRGEVKKSTLFSDLGRRYGVLAQIAALAATLISFEKGAQASEKKEVASNQQMSPEAIVQRSFNVILRTANPKMEYLGENQMLKDFAQSYKQAFEDFKYLEGVPQILSENRKELVEIDPVDGSSVNVSTDPDVVRPNSTSLDEILEAGRKAFGQNMWDSWLPIKDIDQLDQDSIDTVLGGYKTSFEAIRNARRAVESVERYNETHPDGITVSFSK